MKEMWVWIVFFSYQQFKVGISNEKHYYRMEWHSCNMRWKSSYCKYKSIM